MAQDTEQETEEIEETVRSRIIKIILEHFKNDELVALMLNTSLEHTLYELGDESLDAAAIVIDVEYWFSIDIAEEADVNMTVQGLIDLVEQVLPSDE